MDSSSESSSPDEAVLVVAETPRLRSRRKPKHPQKIWQRPRTYGRQSSSSGYSSSSGDLWAEDPPPSEPSSGELSSGEHSTGHSSDASSSGDPSMSHSSDTSSHELSYADIAADFDFEEQRVTIEQPVGGGEEFFLPADGDGFYIVTTQPLPERSASPVDRGFSVYDNLALTESISDEDDDDDDEEDEGRLKVLTMSFGESEFIEKTVERKSRVPFAEELFRCPLIECDRFFDDAARLNRHIKIVHGPKSCSCPKCGKSFTQYGHLQVHLKTVHTTATPYECKVCHRRFNVSSNRNRHERLHFTEGSQHFIKDL